MTEDPSHPQEAPNEVESGPIHMRMFTNSSALGPQTWTAEQGQHDYRMEKLRVDTEKQERKDLEIAKENARRRRREDVGFFTVLGSVITFGLISLILGIFGDDDYQPWMQGAYTTILGGLLGGVAGYIAAGKTK